MAVFSVKGPSEVPFQDNQGGRVIEEDLTSFWERNKKVRKAKGCYIFAVRAGKGYTPLYVGKTTKSFEKECFADHKLNHYHRALSEYGKGTPVIFFVYLDRPKGATNRKEIGEVEEFLIQIGRTINEGLRNIKSSTLPEWGIKGVIRGGKGKSSSDSKNFKKLMKL